MQYNIYSPDTGWSYPDFISESPQIFEMDDDLGGCDIAVDSSGEAFAVWIEYENYKTYIMGAVYR